MYANSIIRFEVHNTFLMHIQPNLNNLTMCVIDSG